MKFLNISLVLLHPFGLNTAPHRLISREFYSSLKQHGLNYDFLIFLGYLSQNRRRNRDLFRTVMHKYKICSWQISTIFFIISRGKLPSKPRAGLGIFTLQRVRQIDFAEALAQIVLMQLLDFEQMVG